MKRILLASIISIFGVFALCSCQKISEEAPDSTSDSISSAASETDVTTTVDTEDTQTQETSVSTDLYIELPEYSVMLSDISKDSLPDFSTSYLDAELPEVISDNLYIYGECNLHITERLMIKFRRSNTDLPMFNMVYNYIQWGFTIIEPKLFYDSGTFYIVGKNELTGYLVKIDLDTDSLFQLGINADTASISDIKEIVSYNFERLATLVRKQDNTYSFYRLGQEICNFNVGDVNPEDLLFNKPFITNDNTLYYIYIPVDVGSRIKIHKEADVNKLYNCVYAYSGQSAYLYENHNGNPSLIGFDTIFGDTIQFEFERDTFSDLSFKIDEYNRCFIYSSDITFEDENSEEHTFSPTIGIFVCDIPEKKLESEEVKEILSRKFSYDEKDDIIEELLSYI